MSKLFSYWVGPVTWIERLSCASAIATGNDLTILTPNPAALEREGLGCKIMDVGEVFHDPSIEYLRTTLPSHYSDHVRLDGIAKGLGTWVDLDLVFFKPLPDDDYLFGWEWERWICGAVLRLPIGSALLEDYRAALAERPIRLSPKWLPLPQRIHRRAKRVRHAVLGRPKPAPLLGPVTLTHLVNKHGLQAKAKSRTTFYPLPYGRPHMLRLAEPGFIESTFTDDTIAVHLWHSLFRKVHGTVLPPCQWLQDAYMLHCEERWRPWEETIPKSVGRPHLNPRQRQSAGQH
jgi:hypothetical protein